MRKTEQRECIAFHSPPAPQCAATCGVPRQGTRSFSHLTSPRACSQLKNTACSKRTQRKHAKLAGGERADPEEGKRKRKQGTFACCTGFFLLVFQSMQTNRQTDMSPAHAERSLWKAPALYGTYRTTPYRTEPYRTLTPTSASLFLTPWALRQGHGNSDAVPSLPPSPFGPPPGTSTA